MQSKGQQDLLVHCCLMPTCNLWLKFTAILPQAAESLGLALQGLAEQLLNVVVKHERADLEEQRESLIQQMSSNKVLLSNLEESLLSNLSNASGNILDNQVCRSSLQAA